MKKWSEFVSTHGPSVYRTAWRILGHVQDSEDIVQEVFIEAHRKFVAGDVAHWSTLLHRMTTYRAIDCLRRRRSSDVIEADQVKDTQATPEQKLLAEELETQVRTIVASLPERQAAVFCLIHFDEKTVAEAATVLDITGNAVSLALHKARLTLKEKIYSRTEEPRS